MEKETKKYLIIGTTIVVTVGVGVLLWRKYQTQSASTAAATDQSNQDELSLLAASLESNAYASTTGGSSGFSPQAVGAGTPKSLADEVLALEQALGFAPTTPSSSTAAPTGSGSGTPSTTPASSPPSSTGAPTEPIPVSNPARPAHEVISEMLKYHHGSPLFEMDGVQGEGVT